MGNVRKFTRFNEITDWEKMHKYKNNNMIFFLHISRLFVEFFQKKYLFIFDVQNFSLRVCFTLTKEISLLLYLTRK